MKEHFKNVKEYIDSLPFESAENIRKMREAIKQAAPQATEKISYNMPAFELNGMLCYYAAFTNHVSLFPYSSAIVEFKSDLKNYKTSRGTIQFPIERPLPIGLIKKIIRFRVKEKLKPKVVKKKFAVKKKSKAR